MPFTGARARGRVLRFSRRRTAARSADMIAFAFYMPRLVRRFIRPRGLFISSYGKHTHHRPTRPITYGNGRARLTFLPRSILSTRLSPRPSVLFSLSLFFTLPLCLLLLLLYLSVCLSSCPSICFCCSVSRSHSFAPNVLIAAENRGLSQHERSVNPRPLVFSTFL